MIHTWGWIKYKEASMGTTNDKINIKDEISIPYRSSDYCQATSTNPVYPTQDCQSVFAYWNLKGCPLQVHSHCYNYKGLVRPVLEYVSAVSSPHQEKLIKSLEAVQRRSARRIFRDFRPTASASSLVSNPNLQPLEDRRTTNKGRLYVQSNEWSCWLKSNWGGTDIDSQRSHLPKANQTIPEFPIPEQTFTCTRSSFPRPSDCGVVFHRRDPVLTDTPAAFKAAVEGWVRPTQ